MKALIRVSTLHNRGGDNIEKMNFTVPGSFEKTEAGWIIRYNELEENDTVFGVIVTANPDAVRIERSSGAYSSLLIVRINTVQYGVYNTPYGFANIGVHGEKIEINLTERGGFVKFLYRLDFNGEINGSSEVIIRIIAKED